jgi:hypothetical protein
VRGSRDPCLSVGSRKTLTDAESATFVAALQCSTGSTGSSVVLYQNRFFLTFVAADGYRHKLTQ